MPSPASSSQGSPPRSCLRRRRWAKPAPDAGIAALVSAAIVAAGDPALPDLAQRRTAGLVDRARRSDARGRRRFVRRFRLRRANVHGALRGQTGRHRHGADAARRGVQTGEPRARERRPAVRRGGSCRTASGRHPRSDAAGLSPAALISWRFRSSSCVCWPRPKPSRRRSCLPYAGAPRLRRPAAGPSPRDTTCSSATGTTPSTGPSSRISSPRSKRDGYRVAIDERDFLANASFLLEMERCIRESRFTVAVISPRYLESGNALEEAIISKVLDMGDRKRRLIPLVIEAVCAARLALRHRRHRLHETRPAGESVRQAQGDARRADGVMSAHPRWTLVATILGSSMTFIDATVVNVALPALQADLHATITDVQWVIEAYALFLGALILVGGSLGDQFGRKRVFLAGVVVLHGRVDACAAWRPSPALLIAGRALQGIGAAFLVPGSLAIISATFDDADRGRAIGTWSGFSAITTAIGPVQRRLADRTRQLARRVLPERAARRRSCSRCRCASSTRAATRRETRGSTGPARRSPSSAWAASSSACSNGRRSEPAIRSCSALSSPAPCRWRCSLVVEHPRAEPDAAARLCSGREPSRSPTSSRCCCTRRSASSCSSCR